MQEYDTPTDAEPTPAILSAPAAPSASKADRWVEGLVVGLAPGLFEVVVDGVTYLCTLRGRLRRPRQLAQALVRGTGRGREGGPARGARDVDRGLKSPAHESAGRRGNDVAPESPDVADTSDGMQKPVRIAPGDRVLVTLLGNGVGVIEDTLPRANALTRMRSEIGSEQTLMANVDLAVLVFAAQEPPPNIGLLDRYLALCEHAAVPPLICLNKVDLGVSDETAEALALYAALGYLTLRTSAATGEGVADLREQLIGRRSLLTGPSGVGKSSLMNILIPSAGQRIAAISEATGKGRHTTTGARLLPLPEGGWLADTAGIRELALWNVPPEELAACFVELRPYADGCLYENCSHAANEEGCALQAALAGGRIAPSRFASFQRLLGEARNEIAPSW